jgi:hypothetical protein
VDEIPLVLVGGTGDQAGHRDRSGIDHRIGQAIRVFLDPLSELNGSPVAFTPTLLRASLHPSAWATSANKKGLETLMIENSMVRFTDGMDVAVHPTTQIPKDRQAHLRQRGVNLEFFPVFGLESLVGFDHQGLHLFGWRQVSGGHVGITPLLTQVESGRHRAFGILSQPGPMLPLPFLGFKRILKNVSRPDAPVANGAQVTLFPRRDSQRVRQTPRVIEGEVGPIEGVEQ